MRQRASWGVLWGALLVGCGPTRVVSESAPSVALTLLHTSDIHSRLWPFRARISEFEAEHGFGPAGTLSEVGGAARLATLLERERRRGAALWLDSGDALEGAPIFQRFGGQVELGLLSSLGLSAMALGNHELSLTAGELAKLLDSAADFPVLAANLQPKLGSPLEGRIVPSTLLQAQGLRVGVVGVANLQSPPGLAQADNDWQLDAIAEAAAAVQLALDELSTRAALVVVLSHLGLDADRALVRRTTGIAAVLGGHQHLLTAEPEWQDDCATGELAATRGCSPRRVPIVHSGAYAQWLTRLELQLIPDPLDSAKLEVTRAASQALPNLETLPGNPEVEAYLAERLPAPTAPVGFLQSALPRRSPLGGDSALGDLTTDAVRLDTGADVVLLNSSGLREDLEAGVLLRSDLELAFPFAEPWRLLRLSGSVLRQGLLRAARRSASSDCESSLQVAGLRLRLRCGACSARSSECLQIERDSAFGHALLADDEWLLVALPAYLTLPGADFEADASLGTELELSVPDAIGSLVAALPASPDPEHCSRALAAWPKSRCREAFEALECPLATERQRAVCSTLPLVGETRDGRIELRP